MALLVQTSSAPSRSACWTASCKSGLNCAKERRKVLVRHVWNVYVQRGRTVFDKVVQSGIGVFGPFGDGREPTEDGR